MESATSFNDLPKVALELCLGGAGMMLRAVPNKMCRDYIREVVQNPRMMAAHLIARHEAYGEASRMIKASFGVNTIDREQVIRGMKAALIVAVRNTHVDVVTLILETGVDISEVVDKHGWSVPIVSIAVMNGSLSIAELLVNRGADLSNDSLDKVFIRAISKSNDTVVDWIMDHGLGHPLDLLEEALRRHKIRYVWRALKDGANPEHVGEHVAVAVAKTERTDVMGLMIDIGVTVCGHACIIAQQNSSPAMNNFLQDRGVSGVYA